MKIFKNITRISIELRNRAACSLKSPNRKFLFIQTDIQHRDDTKKNSGKENQFKKITYCIGEYIRNHKNDTYLINAIGFLRRGHTQNRFFFLSLFSSLHKSNEEKKTTETENISTNRVENHNQKNVHLGKKPANGEKK